MNWKRKIIKYTQIFFIKKLDKKSKKWQNRIKQIK